MYGVDDSCRTIDYWLLHWK